MDAKAETESGEGGEGKSLKTNIWGRYTALL